MAQRVLPVNYDTDYLWMDGVENITLRQQNPSEGDLENVKAIRSEPNQGQVQAVGGGLGVQGEDVTWLLFQATLQQATPKQGDIVIDPQGVKWTILSSTRQLDFAQWRCPCKRHQGENRPNGLEDNYY